MPTNAEGRIIALELAIKWLKDRLAGIQTSVSGLQNQNRQQPAGSYSGGGGGSASNVYVVLTGGGGIAGGTAPPGGAPGSASLTVYQIIGGAYSSVGTATVYNPYLSATAAAAKVLTVGANGDGTYTVLGESLRVSACNVQAVGGCQCVGCIACSPCCIPDTTLTASWSGTHSGSSGMAHGTGGLSWSAAASPFTVAFTDRCYLSMNCSAGNTNLFITDIDAGGTFITLAFQSDWACSPFHVHGKVTGSTGNAALKSLLLTNGYDDFFVDP